jgi:hypothetical protein
MTDDDLTIHVPMEQPLYELLQLEAERMDYDHFEEFARRVFWRHVTRVHQTEFRVGASPPVGVDDETARRMQLMAEIKRRADADYPWADTVSEFLSVLAEPIDEGHENVRPEWVDGHGDAE